MTKTTRTAIITQKEEETFVFFVVCFQQTPEKNSCRFLFLRENCRSSSYQRSFFLFTGDFWLCKHKTYNYKSFKYSFNTKLWKKTFLVQKVILTFFFSLLSTPFWFVDNDEVDLWGQKNCKSFCPDKLGVVFSKRFFYKTNRIRIFQQ